MTTAAYLRKKAIEIGFDKKLKEIDFKIGPTNLWFYRYRAEYIDYIGFWLSSSKNWADVAVICLNKELINHCEMSEFPKGFDIDIPFYSSTFINDEYGVEIGSDPWKIKNDSDIELSLNEIYKLIIKSANSWFLNIDSNQKLWESYTLNFRERETSNAIMKALLHE